MIFKRFFKPKWQHNDAAVRQQAIAQLDQQNQEHKSILHELAFNDGAEAVRKAALLKLNDFSLWWQASKHDSAERLQQLAEQTLIEQLLQNKVEAKLKLQFIAQCNRSSILEQLAQTETDAGIKFSLLQRLNKAELNYKALQEPVLQLAQKRQLLAGLTDEKVLEKLARQLDGELQTEVLQKLQALHEQKQKPPQLRKQLTLLLAKLNALRERTALEQIPAQLEEYQAQWLQLEPELECLAQEAQEFRTKYEKIISQLQQWLAPKLAQLNEIQAQQQRETKQRAAYQALQQQVDALKQGLQQALLNADISAAQQLESHLQAVEQAFAELKDALLLGLGRFACQGEGAAHADAQRLAHVGRRRGDGDERQHDVALLDVVLDPLAVDRDVALDEPEAQPAPGRVARTEAQRAVDQPREHHQHEQDQRDVDHPHLEMRRQAQADHDHVGDQPALEDGDRVGQVFERRAGQARVAVEVALGAHLGPGRIDAEREHGQHQVHEPDAEELAGAAGELGAMAGGPGRRFGGRGRRHRGRCRFHPCDP